MKTVLFAFNGDPMCFVHVLLNAFDLKKRGHEVKIVLEGSATKLARTFYEDPALPFAKLYAEARDEGLISCACKACTAKMGAKEAAIEQGIELCGEMKGHPSVAPYLEQGWTVLTF